MVDKHRQENKMSHELRVKRLLERIRAIRKSRNMTQTMLGQRIGMTQKKYSQIELGISKLQLETLYMIAQALSVSIKELVGD